MQIRETQNTVYVYIAKSEAENSKGQKWSKKVKHKSEAQKWSIDILVYLEHYFFACGLECMQLPG